MVSYFDVYAVLTNNLAKNPNLVKRPPPQTSSSTPQHPHDIDKSQLLVLSMREYAEKEKKQHEIAQQNKKPKT